MAQRHIVGFAAALLLLGLTACGGSSSAGPSSTPTVSGAWDVTFLELGVSGLMNLTETSGSVVGTLQIASAVESLSGTVSLAGAMLLAYRDPVDGEQGVLQVQVDSPRKSLTGTLTITRGSQSGIVKVQGNKR